MFLVPAALAQQIYKWKDKKGQWYFSDIPHRGVKAEKVKGLDFSRESTPATSPYANPPDKALQDSAKKEGTVSRPPLRRPSDASPKDLTSRWLLQLSNGNLMRAFDSAAACERYKTILISNSKPSVVRELDSELFDFYDRSRCVASSALEPLTKEAASVVVLSTQFMRDQKRVAHYIISGELLNRGQNTAKNVVVIYQVRNNAGVTIKSGKFSVRPRNLPRGGFGEYRGQIIGIPEIRSQNLHTEVQWSKD